MLAEPTPSPAKVLPRGGSWLLSLGDEGGREGGSKPRCLGRMEVPRKPLDVLMEMLEDHLASPLLPCIAETDHILHHE